MHKGTSNAGLIFALVFSVLFLSLPLSVQASQKSPLMFACSHFPPYLIENGDNQGINIDLISAAFAATGQKTEFNFYPWKRAYQLVKDGQAHSLCGCSYRPDREKIFLFSDMLGHISQGVFRKSASDNRLISKLEDLNGLSVATIRGYALQKELEARNIPNTGVLGEKQLVKMLLSERIDSIYAYKDVILYDMALLGKTEPLDYSELSSQPHYLCFSRQIAENALAVKAFNKGLRIIRLTGEYKAIRSRYLSLN